MDLMKKLLIAQAVRLLKLSNLKKAVLAGLTAFFAAWELDILPSETVAKLLAAAAGAVDALLALLNGLL